MLKALFFGLPGDGVKKQWICVLLCIGIAYLLLVPRTPTREGMSGAKEKKKQLKKVVDDWRDIIETQLEASEEHVESTRLIIPAGESKVASGMKKLWGIHKKLMELQIVQNQFGVMQTVAPGMDQKPYAMNGRIREMLEENVLLGNAITSTDAAMAGLGSMGSAGDAVSGFSSGFGSKKSKDDDDDDGGFGGWLSSKDDDDDDDGGRKKKKKKKSWL